MKPSCASPVDDEQATAYWAGDLPPAEASALEEHVFACGDCSARLETVAALAGGVSALARQGRIAGIISHGLLNRLQRDGVRVRQYTIDPGQTVPCAAFPGDDVVVTSLNADLAGVDVVSLRVTGPGGEPLGAIDDIPVSRAAGGLLWATPGELVRSMPSQQLRLSLRTADGVIAEYVLDHSHEP